MTPAEAEQILASLKAAYPHADNGLDPIKAKDRDALYRAYLLDCPSSASARAAARQILRTLKWYPAISEFEAAYAEQRQPHPERAPVPQLASGNTPASPEEIKAACAEAVAIVERNAVVPTKRVRAEGTPASVRRELEAMRARGVTPPELDRKSEGAGEG